MTILSSLSEAAMLTAAERSPPAIGVRLQGPRHSSSKATAQKGRREEAAGSSALSHMAMDHGHVNTPRPQPPWATQLQEALPTASLSRPVTGPSGAQRAVG
ncbi:hypothetical protein AAFF_G00424700 [Aldrovandia affinis]|uniref:Uncharacterized protein n=1 Tax=Aldrovandia affinis TaxID=143900 RepID=A0AAD7T6Z4_9TELE|nr:hypothetical protein AAFF_G00424700 [Aldrovandia affinis]